MRGGLWHRDQSQHHRGASAKRNRHGLSAALFGEITLKDGRVEQSNFDNYRALHINEMPGIDVHIVKSNEPPGGMGEPGTSALVPAVFNAVYAATGVRLRKPPIAPDQLKT